ncbi:hypothetical protein B0H10DRAFT_2227328 [Mycena sp. CBHHK59/15]|nr:hypothetical protein B0H10DRAFT_2227328 [Mycena sp. CBHHK59/15]
MGLGKDQRDAFLKESVPRKLTLLQYHVLTQMLDAWVEQQYKFAQTLIEIPRIAAGLEFFHSRPDTCPKLLAKRMRVSKDEYDILVRYQDFWPILVIAKRILATPDAYRSSNVASNHGFDFAPPSPSASQSMSQYEEYTLPSVQQWQRHRHVCAQMMEYLVASGAQRVSPAAKALLSILHMEEELAPALWRLGVHFDEDFEMVKQMRSEGKKELVEGPTNGLRLKDFQKLVLHLIFKK